MAISEISYVLKTKKHFKEIYIKNVLRFDFQLGYSQESTILNHE